jgi:rRNA maturation endonuclease Nob1
MVEIREQFGICPKCKTAFKITPKDWKYCEQCGTEIITACPGCNKIIRSSDAKFCRSCGANYLHPEKHPE